MQNDDAPGPWAYDQETDDSVDFWVFQSNGPTRVAVECSEADARLIAAAPDLLAALELLLNVEGAAHHGARLPGFIGLDVEYHFAAARAAIARATGADHA